MVPGNYRITTKVMVSILFGLSAFILNFHAINFAQFVEFKASILLGLLFPLLISLAWGWKFGLLSALAGGCQSMWWLWRTDGYGVFYAVPVFTLWILWHGIWADYRKNKGPTVKWYHSMYVVELIFRIFSEAGFYTIFRWLVSFNPPPWNPDIIWNHVSYSWIHFVVIKHMITAYILILIAHVLLNIGPFRKFFMMPHKPGQKSTTFVVSAFLLLGIFLWIIDSVVVHYAFSQSTDSLLTAITSNISPRDLFVRNLFLLICLVSGLLVSRFLAERHAANQKIRELNRDLELRVHQRTVQLEETNKELEDFVYSVSHDLRAPLRSISGFAEIINRRHKSFLNEEGQHYFDNIVKAGRQMGDLIDDLLKFSRLGRKAITSENVSLDDVFKTAIKTLSDEIQKTDGRINLPEQIPDIQGDVTLTTHIFINLLENALKYHQPNLPPVINVSFEMKNQDVVVSVADNGIGIAPEYHEKIFNIFQRLHSQEDYPGTGIGLASVKKAAHIMGGRVWVESEPGKGSVFKIRFLTATTAQTGKAGIRLNIDD